VNGEAGQRPFRKRLACDGLGSTKPVDDRHGQKRVTQVADPSRLWQCHVRGAYHGGENRWDKSNERIYANYQTYETAAGSPSVFAQNHARLLALKQKHDPTNFFHRNANIAAGRSV
jgi:hypothetical protein